MIKAQQLLLLATNNPGKQTEFEALLTGLDAKLVKQLLWLREQIHACDGILRLCGLSPQNEAFLRTYDLSGSIAHYCNRESAVMGQDSPRRPR